ncbi:MAG: endonuclease/exonuclease/phosphatase family protein, partial [Rhodospirillaceae bacterium]|nr:endonuclease/exonuclease/phosphatase family protein [Rhodospirillaceae bacterium]
MKIISWNCNCAFRSKFEHIQSLDPDILIIQECEDPDQVSDEAYKAWAKNFLWTGANKNKGLGIFARPEITLTPLPWASDDLELFLPCRINNEFNLVGVWTKYADSATYQYIGQFWKYLQKHKESFTKSELMIIGDFNSNQCWDLPDRNWNHSDVVRELSEINIESLYHLGTGEKQGAEDSPTFYMQRNLEKPYHIDYFFVSSLFHSKEFSLEVLDHSFWLKHSDHVPVVF